MTSRRLRIARTAALAALIAAPALVAGSPPAHAEAGCPKGTANTGAVTRLEPAGPGRLSMAGWVRLCPSATGNFLTPRVMAYDAANRYRTLAIGHNPDIQDWRRFVVDTVVRPPAGTRRVCLQTNRSFAVTCVGVTVDRAAGGGPGVPVVGGPTGAADTVLGKNYDHEVNTEPDCSTCF